jgi:hypothetical protein
MVAVAAIILTSEELRWPGAVRHSTPTSNIHATRKPAMADSLGDGSGVLATEKNTPDGMQHAVDVTKRAAKGLVGDVRSEAMALGAEAKQQLGEQASTRLAGVADSIEGLSAGLANTSAELDETWAKPLVGHASEALHSIADYIRTSSADAMMQDAHQLAKERPGTVLIGAVAVGFALARAGKALAAQMPSMPSATPNEPASKSAIQ